MSSLHTWHKLFPGLLSAIFGLHIQGDGIALMLGNHIWALRPPSTTLAQHQGSAFCIGRDEWLILFSVARGTLPMRCPACCRWWSWLVVRYRCGAPRVVGGGCGSWYVFDAVLTCCRWWSWLVVRYRCGASRVVGGGRGSWYVIDAVLTCCWWWLWLVVR